MSDLICWTLATGMRCMAMTGPMNAPFTDFYIQRGQEYAAPAPRSTLRASDYDAMYRAAGMRTNHEYFCNRAAVHPMDREFCSKR
jgi:hypothetical protein